ncbi:hypothetical protein [Anaerotignum sp.]|uniref:hypothetical protein n=1 Tax=Anaerotignum sp. TaxID=2039241 RepID=UPI0028B0C25A|nr:hypothetical protein [Anaerotignum sp.]
MSYKSITVIPPVSKFENILGVKDRKVRAAAFVLQVYNHSNKAMLGRMKFLDIVGLFTSEKGFQRGSHRMRKIFDLYNKGELDLLICNSKDDLFSYESGLSSLNRSILKNDIPVYCVKDCILIKNGHDISLR